MATASNLAIRLLTAAVVAPLLLVLLFLGPAWGWFTLVLVASTIGGLEVFAMTHPEDSAGRAVGAATTAFVTAALYLGPPDARTALTVGAVVLLSGMMWPLARLGRIEDAALRVLGGISGPLYVGLPLALLAIVRRDQGASGPGWVLLTLMLSWLADTGGYFAGRAFGKTKLYPAVSPKKTREGFYGALAGAVSGALLAHFWYLPVLPLAHAVPLALVGGALGQLGDLAESLLKRSTGIKDSGAIVPGHGGMLDRIDALLVATVIVYLYTAWLAPA